MENESNGKARAVFYALLAAASALSFGMGVLYAVGQSAPSGGQQGAVQGGPPQQTDCSAEPHAPGTFSLLSKKRKAHRSQAIPNKTIVHQVL